MKEIIRSGRVSWPIFTMALLVMLQVTGIVGSGLRAEASVVQPSAGGNVPSKVWRIPVIFPDINLDAAIRDAIHKPFGDIESSDLLGLQELDASSSNIESLFGLQYCVNLTSLTLNDNQIDDVTPLANLDDLESLDLAGNQVVDLGPLAGLSNLKILELSQNSITDITPLAGLSALEDLGLGGNLITDIGALAGLNSLVSLAVWDNQILDISALAGLTGLGYLDVDYNQIADIDPLATLTNLSVLRLLGNQIVDISSLAGLLNLRNLELSANLIEHVGPLIGLVNLEFLYLHSNLITDIMPLLGNQGLGSLDYVGLLNNPLNQQALCFEIPPLEARGVFVEHYGACGEIWDEGDCVSEWHSADQTHNNLVELTELLRVIQFFNSGGYYCADDPSSTEDGYLPGLGADKTWCPHDSDYAPSGPDWKILLTELLRVIQFFNSSGYLHCPGEGTEDGFCPGS